MNDENKNNRLKMNSETKKFEHQNGGEIYTMSNNKSMKKKLQVDSSGSSSRSSEVKRTRGMSKLTRICREHVSYCEVVAKFVNTKKNY